MQKLPQHLFNSVSRSHSHSVSVNCVNLKINMRTQLFLLQLKPQRFQRHSIESLECFLRGLFSAYSFEILMIGFNGQSLFTPKQQTPDTYWHVTLLANSKFTLNDITDRQFEFSNYFNNIFMTLWDQFEFPSMFDIIFVRFPF